MVPTLVENPVTNSKKKICQIYFKMCPEFLMLLTLHVLSVKSNLFECESFNVYQLCYAILIIEIQTHNQL